LRGALWYQGEGDVDRPEYYAQALPAMIEDWRQLWEQNLAFGVVQLPNFKRPQREAINQGWSDFREAQYRGVQAVKNAGIVTTIDIGEAFNIHPKNKQEVGKRLALWALANVYGNDVIWSGPIYKSMKVEGDKIRISFDHVHAGLRTKGDELKGFAIADESKVFRFAQAKIDGDTIVVWSDKVREPVAVRYAWAENPICNLFNEASLPARPFRTDSWAISEVKAAEDEELGK
jgi:sialate O-acetylesterase